MGKVLLRPTMFLADLSDIVADELADIHVLNEACPQTIDLQTMSNIILTAVRYCSLHPTMEGHDER